MAGSSEQAADSDGGYSDISDADPFGFAATAFSSDGSDDKADTVTTPVTQPLQAAGQETVACDSGVPGEASHQATPEPKWAISVKSFFAKVRESLGEQTRNLRAMSACTGLWTEGMAMKV